jgi:hypothetical protein
MATEPEIRILQVEHGLFPAARALNPRFGPESPLLLASLLVRWEPEDPAGAVAALEERLLAFSPGFARHECRGLETYHIFAPGRRAVPPTGPPVFEAGLMLAHLIEHAVIDFQCAVSRQRRCSGATAARRDGRDRYDLLVECRDFPVGRCCLGLAVTWLSAAADGHPPGAPEREILAAARLAHERRGESLTPALIARVLRWPGESARRALAALSEVGYLVESPYSVNLSGVPQYRVSMT